MLNEEGVCVVNDNVVAVLTHYSEFLEGVVWLAWDSFRKSDMYEFWWKLQVHHFDWKMLSCGVVDGYLAVFTAGDQQFP